MRPFVVAGLVLVLALAAWQGFEALRRIPGPAGCDVRGPGDASLFLDSDQAGNAATIAGVAIRRGLPTRAADIAIATARQESKLRNLDHGDRDSLGLFQQRPSQGWGTEEQIMDPVYSANAFYAGLVKRKNWATRPLTQVAQEVQRSGYPEAYAKHEDEAQLLAAAFSGDRPFAVTCRLDPVTRPADTDTFVRELRRTIGVRAVAGDRPTRLVVGTDSDRGAAATAAWAVGEADRLGVTRVSVDGRTWTRGRGRDADTWHPDATLRSGPRRVVVDLGPAR